jgi:predicted transcriptional regulator
MADHPSIKADARQLIEGLPESATWDDLAYEVYVRQAIERGLADSEAGRTLPHDEALARIRSRIRRVS